MYYIGIIGDIILDILLVVDEFPLEDSEVTLKKEQFNLGGSAFNTAYELTKTGLHPLLLSTFGKDSTGLQIKDMLKEKKLDDTFIFQEETNTGKIYILLSPDGKRTMISSRSKKPIPLNLDIYRKFVEKTNWLHVSGYLFTVREQYERATFAMKEAKKRGISVSLDPGTNTIKNNPTELVNALQYTDFFLPNREEFDLLNTIDIYLEKDIRNTIIVKEGQEGATLINPTHEQKVPSKKRLNATNSIGAGDAFNAGFIFGMLTTGDLIRSTIHGNEFAYRRLLEQAR